jgi:O-antigen/teichoic acid export membrane protein
VSSGSSSPLSSRATVLWSVAPRLLSRASALILLPLYTRWLRPDELGLALVALAAGGAVSLVMAPGIEAVYLRWAFRSHHGEASALGTVARLHVAMIVAALAVLMPAGGWISATLLPGVPLSFSALIVAVAVLVSAAAPLRAEWRARRAARMLAAAEVGQAMVSAVTVLLGFLVLQWGAMSLLAGEVAAGLVLAGPALVRLSAHARLGWSRSHARLVMPLAVSGLPLGVALWALAALDRVFLNHISGAEAVALYGVAYQVAAAVMLISVILDKEWEVVVAAYGAAGKGTESAHLLQSLWSLSVSLFLIGASVLALFSADIVRWGLGRQYAAAATLIPWILLVAVLKVPFSFLVHMARVRNQSAAVISGSLLALTVFVVASLLLIPGWGPVGAAWAGIVAYGVVCLFWFSRQWNSFEIERHMLTSTLVAVAAFVFAMRIGGTITARALGAGVAGLLVYRAVGYWKFLGEVRPVGASI